MSNLPLKRTPAAVRRQVIGREAGGSPQALALQQNVWHINAISGNDNNDGKTSLTALKSFAEWSVRIGNNIVPQATTILLDSDLDEPGYSIRGAFPFGLTTHLLIPDIHGFT